MLTVFSRKHLNRNKQRASQPQNVDKVKHMYHSFDMNHSHHTDRVGSVRKRCKAGLSQDQCKRCGKYHLKGDVQSRQLLVTTEKVTSAPSVSLSQ